MTLGIPELMVLAFLFIIMGIVSASLIIRRKSLQKDQLELKRIDLLSSLLHKFDNPRELVEFLQSDQGKQWTEGNRISPLESPTRAILLVGLAAACLWVGTGMMYTAFTGFAISTSSSVLRDVSPPVGVFFVLGIIGAILDAAAVYFFWLSAIWKKR